MIGAAALVAGCIGPVAPIEAANADVAAGPAAATEFEWRTANLSGDAAIELAFAFAEATKCEKEYAITNGGVQGIDSVQYTIGPDGETLDWGSGASGFVASLHGGPLDTRELASTGGHGATGWGGTTTFPAGVSRVRLHGLGLAAWDNQITEGDAVLVRLDCDAPFTLAGASFTREAFMVSLGAMDEGVGATVLFSAEASVQDATARDFAAASVAAHFLAVGFHGARVELATPEESLTIDVVPGLDLATHYVEGSAGRWSARVTGAGAYFSIFTGVVAGYEPVEGLDAIRDA